MMFKVKTKMNPTGFPPVAETLPQAIKKIVREFKPEKIILFGSYAQGNPTHDSDVDLLVIMETNLPRTERFIEISELLYPRKFPVDIIVKTPSEVKDALESGDFFIREILEKGKTIYERRE
jgi:predicted nucleotidyltransferase